jgi:hypothetical protein
LDPRLKAVKARRHRLAPIGPHGSLDGVGHTEREQLMRLRTGGFDHGQEPIESLIGAAIAEVEQTERVAGRQPVRARSA